MGRFVDPYRRHWSRRSSLSATFTVNKAPTSMRRARGTTLRVATSLCELAMDWRRNRAQVTGSPRGTFVSVFAMRMVDSAR
ncbi:Uncharacterised protein [Mycobacteroides abscessus subsp. abscessus]|nr:Uncharacterised protein [Mycobacteroides abscessus subsp. abscessus]